MIISTVEKLHDKIATLIQRRDIPSEYGTIFTQFLDSYQNVLKIQGKTTEKFLPLFATFLDLVKKQFASPHPFEPLHRAIFSPFDYYQFGIDFLLPLVDLPGSTISGLHHLEEIKSLLQKKENVILFANHQAEADPQAISILLRNHSPRFAKELFFVAGTRVISDPLAIPFSMGRNLLCIYSKKYIDHPPEKKHTKQLHNKRTLERMVELLNEGGSAIYVAPSGGRDRANENGHVQLAPFDPQSIKLLYLMAKKSQRKTHFYTLALSTYHLLPPPETSETKLGESRITQGGAIHLAFGEKVDMDQFPGADQAENQRDKKQRRADFIWEQVKRDYARFPSGIIF